MASKFIIDDALISDMLNFSAKPSPSYRQAEDYSLRGLESLLIPDAPGVPEGEAYYPQTAESGDSRFSITQKALEEVGNSFKGIIDMHSEGMKQLDKDFADDPIARNALKTLGYISTGFNTAVTAGFSPFMLGTAYVGDIVANITGDETQGKQIFRDLNTFLIGKGGEVPMSFKIPSKKGVVEAIVNKDGSINVGNKTYGGDLNLTRAQFMELVRRETFGSAGRETGNLNLAPLREDGLPPPTVEKTIIPKIETKDIPNNTPISVKPIPKKVAVDKGMNENEGVYMANIEGKNVDLKDTTFNTGNVSVTPEGIPKFTVQDPINRDIEKVKGAKLTKVNLFKKEAGWNWIKRPDGANDKFLVSIEQGGKHYYTLNSDISADVQLKYYPNQKSEPRLRPTVYDDIILGEPVGEIDVRGVKHPVYNTIELTPPKQALGADVTPKDEGKVLQFEKKEEPPRDESSGMAADSVPPQYGPPAFDLTQKVKEEFSPEGFSTFSTDVGPDYQRLDDFIYVRPSNDPIQSTIYKEQLNFIDSLKKIKGNPNAKVVMYRAAPTKELREGDLLTPSKTEAKFYVDESKITRDDIRKAERDRRLSEDVVDLQKEKNIKAIENIQDIFGEQKVTPSQLFKYELDAKDVRWDGGNRGILGWGYFPSKDKTIYHPLDRVFKKQIREVLSTDLLSPQYVAKLEKNSDISCGQCYAAAEALYHKWGKFNGFTPAVLNSKTFPEGLEGNETHWFLKNEKGEILDPTAEQFGNTPIPYNKGRGMGFLTKEPAKNKGKEVLNRLGTEKVIQTPSGVVIDFANQKGVETENGPLDDWLRQHNYDIKYNFPEKKDLGDVKNITGKDPRFLVGFTTKDGNQGYLYGYGTDKNIGFIEYIANVGTKDRASTETPLPLKPSELKEIKNELQKHYGFRQFAGDRITGVRRQNRDQGDNPEIFAITPKPESAVDLMLNPFTADIAKSGKIKKEDIARFFDERPTRDINDPKAFKEMVNEAVDEIYYQLQQEVTGEGWYDEGVKKAMKIAEKINPKFKNNPDLKDLILFTTAIASSGVSVGLDFKVGLQVADIFADTGKIPLTNPYTGDGWTVRGTNLSKQLSLANNYIQKNGLSAFLEFLHTEMTGREVQKFRKEYGNLGPSKGVKMDEIYTGDRAFGPKIGEFMANLYGTADNNVVDMWNVRSMNRLIGDMFVRDKNGKVVLNNKGEPIIKDGFPTITMKRKFDEFMQAVANIIGKSVRDTQAIRWYFEQGLYTKLGKKSVPKDYGTAAQEVLESKQSNNSPTGVSQSKTSDIKSKTPTKKAQGGSISIPERRSLVNDSLVDINYIIGNMNYGR